MTSILEVTAWGVAAAGGVWLTPPLIGFARARWERRRLRKALAVKAADPRNKLIDDYLRGGKQ